MKEVKVVLDKGREGLGKVDPSNEVIDLTRRTG
jgi:hypothetical protein